MIHHQLPGLTIASRLKYLASAPQAALRSRQACVYRIRRTIPLTCVTNSRITRVGINYATKKLIQVFYR